MKCDYPHCNSDEDILFYCRYCRGSFCEKHRDPQAHNCPALYGSHGPSTQSTTTTPVDVIKRFAYQVAQQAQQAADRPVYFKDEKARNKYIEKRLLASKDLFSLGNEVIDLIFGFSLIVLVFGFYQYVLRSDWWGFLISAILVGTAFVPHELAHKVVAIRRGQYARYVLWVRGLFLTFLTLFIGIGLIVPGFVAIVPLTRRMNKEDTGVVSLAGPMTNAVIGFVSLIFGLLSHSSAFGVFSLPAPFASPNIFLLVAQFNALIYGNLMEQKS
ncbi:MAG: AN1-type zinc finger domain-containing protein [Candidatus Heimdallarchaeaceae archaeon]